MATSMGTIVAGALGDAARFQHLAGSSELWMDSAEKLKKSADVLLAEMKRAEGEFCIAMAHLHQWSERPNGTKPYFCMEDWSLNIRTGDVYFLLAGLCIENVLKGIIVHAQPMSATQQGKLTKALRCHDLVKLVKKAGLDADLSKDERAVLENAGASISYWGRYHIPDHFAKLGSQHGWDEIHFQCFNILYRRWAERLMRLFAVSTYGTTFPGDCHETRMSPDEYIRWRLDRKKPGEV